MGSKFRLKEAGWLSSDENDESLPARRNCDATEAISGPNSRYQNNNFERLKVKAVDYL